MKLRSSFNPGGSLLVVFVLAATVLRAQTIIDSVADSHTVPAVAASNAAPTKAVGSLSNLASALSTDLPLFRRGPFAFRPHVLYRALHGTGIEAGPAQTLATTVQTFSPGLEVDGGLHWRADYTPTWQYYSNHAFKDSFDQAAALSGTYAYDNWTFGINGSYGSSHPVLVETARQSHEVKYGAGVFATCVVSQQLQLNLSANESTRRANSVVDAPEWVPSRSKEWSSSDSLQYAFSPQLQFAGGATFGYAEPQIGPSMSYVQPNIRVIWDPTDQLTFNGEAGVEQRRFRSSDAHDLNNPVYSAGLRYRPIKVTTLLVDASRGVSASYLADVVTRSTTWTFGLEQRVLEVLFLTVTASRSDTTYVATRDAVPNLRDDRFTSLQTRLAVPVLQHGSIGVFYQRTRNSSSQAAYAFSSNQVGVEVTIRF